MPLLSDAEVALLREAIDSHIYWQLSDPRYRNNGEVIEPCADDPDDRAMIATFRALADRLTS